MMKSTFTNISVFTLFYLLVILSVTAQELSKEQIETATTDVFPDAVENLISFLKIPNDGNYVEHIDKNLNECNTIFTEMGFQTKTLATEGAPLLFAQREFKKNTKTVLFYLQIDGQPVDTTAWNQTNPYIPVIKEKSDKGWAALPQNIKRTNLDKEWRIFARSASDSKGPAMAFITAMRILDKMKITPAYNIKVIMDFQEELGSPTLPKAVEKYRELLDTDAILIMDGTRHLSNLPTLTYGARGITTATLKVFGAERSLHSGQYGNFAPNPVFETARLLSSLKNEDGRVLIPGFYDGIVLSDSEKKKLNEVPEDIQEIKESLGISSPDLVGETYQESLQYPSLNIRGLKAAWVGKEVRTLIPSEVVTEIDMRLVPESDGKKLMESLKKYIKDSGFHLVDSIPTKKERATYKKLASFNYKLGSKPFRTSFDSNLGLMLNSAMTRLFGDKFVNMRTTGGSQPISPFINILNVPAVSLRIPNPDNSIHAPNENLRIGNFFEGIMSCLAVLTEPML